MKKRQKILFYILIIVSVLFLLSCLSDLSKVKRDKENYQELNEGWHIEINDQVYENVALDEFRFHPVNKGDVIRMKCTLPSRAYVDNPVIKFYSILSDVEIRYNNQIYYRYGKEQLEKGQLLGYGYHFIHIPQYYAGAEVEIILHISENDAFSSFKVPEIYNSDMVLRDFVIQNRVPLAVNMFLILFGVLVVVVSLVFVITYHNFWKLVCVGFFSLGIGCWSLCNYDLIILFTYNLRVKAYLEYGALYIAPLFVLLYFWGDAFVTRNKKVHGAYLGLLLVQAVFDVTAFTLQFTNVRHFPTLLRIQHLILLFIAGGVVALTIYDLVKKQLTNKVLILGFTMLMIIGLYDMAHFSFVKYNIASKNVQYSSILCVGALIFVLSQLADFGVRIGHIFLQGARTKLLEQMAYVDEMTGLVNRRRCEEIWDSLDQSDCDYGIFAFDLNFLKRTNDTKGHMMGDQLIKSLADVLKKVFGSFGEVGRIGGDEYIVFIPDLTGVSIEKLTQQLEHEMEQKNLENPDLNLSAAYGFCRHSDNPDMDARHLYRKADAAMYEMKVAMKSTREI